MYEAGLKSSWFDHRLTANITAFRQKFVNYQVNVLNQQVIPNVFQLGIAGGQLSIVGTPPLAYSLVPPALRRFLAARPGTQVFFDVRRYEGVIDAVLGRVAELGFALGFSHQPGIAHRVLHTGAMV